MILSPIDASGENIVELPTGYKPPAESERPMLVAVESSQCRHFNTSFIIDVEGDKCVCKACGEKVGAMFVLQRLMQVESQWMRTRAAYQDEMKRLGERSRTKCKKCGEMTRISHR